MVHRSGWNRTRPCFHDLNGRGGQLLHADEPLIGHVGFEHGLAAVAPSHVRAVGFAFLDQPRRLQVAGHGLACLEPVQSRVGAGVFRHVATLVKHDEHRQVVVGTDLVVSGS